ncbi:VCBS repeat-containing protein [Algoriphagus namhaensis]|uniref:VCBS repeat-containing protein n=1 Tax=Algoriphagus namhaensis TaxID=915353 RepID=A0ABV8AN61_9BACT
MKRFTAFLGLTFILFSCAKKEDPTLFELLPFEKTGIDFENNLVSTPEFNILEYLYFYNGGGVAAADFNNDGLIDLFFTGNQVSNELYLNEGDFKFSKITESAGLTSKGSWSTGVTTADVNGDGLLDIYVCQVAGYKGLEGKNRLYINQGDNTFLDLAPYYGVDFEGLSTHAVFFDYDKDGDLDLYLLNHSVKSPEVFAESEMRTKPDPKGDKLFRNKAAQGERGFEDVTGSAGIYSSVLGFGLGVSIEDFNQDGWLDIYVSNDFTENDYLYLNQKDGTFTESLESLIANTSRYSMGNDAGDLNNDGLPEIFTTDMLPQNPEIWMKSVGEDKQEVYDIKKTFGYTDQYVRNNLQLNQGANGFSEIAFLAGVEATDWSWSPLLADLDNDGHKDIHITNGIVKRPNDLDFIQYSQDAPGTLSMEELRDQQIKMLPNMKLPNFTYRNLGNLKFEDVSKSWGLGQESFSNGSTYADLDNDGDLDLILNNLDQPAFIYENHSEKSGNNYLKIRLNSGAQNVFALGAKVSIFGEGNQYSQRLSSSRGFQSGGPAELLFGLGQIRNIDSILVSWNSNYPEVYFADSVNTTLLLEEGSGKIHRASGQSIPALTSAITLPWSHQENSDFDPWDREYLIPRSFANLGPAVAIGDVDGDGDEDIYLGGAKDQAATLLIQDETGNFSPKSNPIFEQLAKAEDVTAAFADLNQDGHLDLYVGSGGNELQSGHLFNFDRVYFGDGLGNFKFSPNSLPPLGENTSTVAIHDLDGDGDLDIFVGVSVVSGDYGASPKSYLLLNQGSGKFVDGTKNWFSEEIEFGMINSATWYDLTGNGQKELILTGDWQGIRIFEKSQNQRLVEMRPKGLEKSASWIQSLELADFNGDGLIDIATGNLGQNSKLKASQDRPAWLYHGDFDENGQNDPIIFHHMGAKLVPFVSRDDLIKQIPEVKRKHTTYASYAQISAPEDLFAIEDLERARKLPAYEFRSGVYFQQSDGSFAFSVFPIAAQLAPINSLLWDENNQTLLLGGNLSGFRVDLGHHKAMAYQALKYADGEWTSEKELLSIPLQAEIRSLKKLSVGNKEMILIIQHNDSPLLLPKK